MKTRAIRIKTEYFRTQALHPAPLCRLDEYHIEVDRTIQTRAGCIVRMILNAVYTEGDV
ncbi:MAG: hypothetical protein IH914_09840 [candidate division Zixibacteria bacterium]|nr:hypothetical protein [candidate division Zixibacteria bacterium]